jgi:HD superfamily phosphohydrolase
MEECLHRNHHEIGPLLEDDRISGPLGRLGIDPEELARVIAGDHPLSGIIYGDLDVDRMDYLLRDAHYTGAPYGTVDAHRLIRNTLIADDGRIVLHESGINAAESLLLARTLMRPSVYFHHVSRIAETMFLKAVHTHILDSTSQAAEIVRMDDAACMQVLLTSDDGIARMLARRIYNRELYKRALYVGKEQVNTASMKEYLTIARRGQVAEEIARGAGLEPHEVLVDIPPFPHAMSMEVQVKNRHQVIGLEEVSPLMNTLNETRQGQWRLGVYTVHTMVKPVAEVAAEVLHIRPVTLQETLRV